MNWDRSAHAPAKPNEADEVDRAGITVFREMTSVQPARQLITLGQFGETVCIRHPMGYNRPWKEDSIPGTRPSGEDPLDVVFPD
jgi:hypothetical protein